MNYYLGIDVGGTKTHALLSGASGQAIGFALGGPGSWEIVGYDGLAHVLQEVTGKVLEESGVTLQQVSAIAFGIAGYDWPSQRQAHLDCIATLGWKGAPILVNDTLLGIAAGAEAGWGISIVSGTGCNCRGISRDRRREGRVIGGASLWSGEAAGGPDIIFRAMRSIVFEWSRRGPKTALSNAFLVHTGANDLDELMEGIYTGRYPFDPNLVFTVFECARQGDAEALEIMRWAGRELGGMVKGVASQLDLGLEPFDVVMIGSIFDGHPLIAESLGETIWLQNPGARLVRLQAPPVVGAVLLAMESAGIDFSSLRQRLVETTSVLISNAAA